MVPLYAPLHYCHYTASPLLLSAPSGPGGLNPGGSFPLTIIMPLRQNALSLEWHNMHEPC